MDERLVSMYRRFTWRILSNYVTPWEFEQLKSEITDYEQWCAAWSQHAARHVERGDAALAAGRSLTAGDAYLRGALAYHWASFVFTHDQAQFRAALEAMGAAWAKAAPLVAPPMELLEVPFEGLVMPGYLRVPDQAGRRSYCYYLGLIRQKRSYTTSPTTSLRADWRWPPSMAPARGC